MRIECEICGTQWDVEKPINNICPFCNSVGSLFIGAKMDGDSYDTK